MLPASAQPDAPNLTQDAEVKMRGLHVNVYYGQNHAIKDVSLDVMNREITALIGPSGCGKSTYLRCLNRMNDTIEGANTHNMDPSACKLDTTSHRLAM